VGAYIGKIGYSLSS